MPEAEFFRPKTSQPEIKPPKYLCPMKGRLLTITVKQDIHKYITESLQSEIVKTERDSTLMNIIKPHLCLEAEAWELEPIPEGFVQLQIELPDLRQVYEARSGKKYYCDTLFRDHITEEGLKKVRNFFKRTYNDKFLTFLAGWVERQHFDNETSDEEKRIQVTSGIVAFFNNYHIDFDEKMIEARRKAWIRYQEKVENYKVSPAFN